MVKPFSARKGNSTPSTRQPTAMSNDVLFIPSDWADGMGFSSFSQCLPMGLAPSTQTVPQLTPASPLSQVSHHNVFPDIPTSAFEPGQYLTVNSQLGWSPDSMLVQSLHTDASSQGSSPRGDSESPSFQDAERELATTPSADATESKKAPKRSRPNRYKNAPPAVIQRRRAANRKSQRAYRKRKDDRIAELEESLKQAESREQEMSHALMVLRAEYEQLLAMGGSNTCNHHHHRNSSATSVATSVTTGTSVGQKSDEEEAASKFMALGAFAQNRSNNTHQFQHSRQHSPVGFSPELAHPQHPQHPQQPVSSPHLLSVYPPL